MVNIDTAPHQNTAQSAVKKAWQDSGVLERDPAKQANTRADTTHDTVSLSEEGQKLVNLSRGDALATEIRDAPVDKGFADNLRQASRDIFRITHLFGETVKSAFSFWR